MTPTHNDAMLMMELAKWGAMIDLQAATNKLFADDFDPEAAGARDPGVDTALAYFETIGTLVKNNLLDADLVFDWLWVGGVWSKVAPAVKRAREATGENRLFENFEALAQGR